MDVPRFHLELNLPAELLPDELRPEFVAKVRTHAVLDLLRAGRLSQSKAAQLLGLTRAELFDVMALQDVPQMNFRPGEVERHAAAFADAHRRSSR